MKTQLVLVLALLGTVSSAGADIYRWTDAQGRVHYSDRPTTDTAQHVAVTQPTNSEAVAQRNAAVKEEQNKENGKEQQQKADQAAAAAVHQDLAKSRAEQCKKAQQDYKVAIESQRLYRIGKDGERQYLTDAEIDASRINARRAMDDLCKEK